MLNLVFLLSLSFSSQAAYRAYELQITNLQTGAQRTVITNFDPEQYRGLYPVLAEEQISLIQSWKCKGDTSHKPVCAKPPPKDETAPPPAAPAP